MQLAKRESAVCVSLHDVAPVTWPLCARILSMLDAIGPVPVTLLVVPNYHKKNPIGAHSIFLRAIEDRIARGDEVALHGFYHLDDAPSPTHPWEWIQRRVLTQREGEFAAISVQEATARLERGLCLMNHLKWPIKGFIAPAWLLGAAVRTVLSTLPFTYTTTHKGIYRLPDWHLTPSTPLVYSVRSAWRRILSYPVNNSLQVLHQKKPLLRLSLHPVDAHFESVMTHWASLVSRALKTRQPMTKADWIAKAA